MTTTLETLLARIDPSGLWYRDGKPHDPSVLAQVAALKKREIAVLEEKMRFPGRVERDDWIKQAKALAKGGAAEYERVFGKKPR